MITIALTDCCAILGIDPKTLRHWLKLAQMSFVPHPMDARLKCLTEQQVQQLAILHGRPFSSPLPASPAVGAPVNKGESCRPVSGSLASSPQEGELLRKLSQLEMQVATLQDQLARLSSMVLAPHLAAAGPREADAPPTQPQMEPPAAFPQNARPIPHAQPEGGRHRPHPAENRRRPVLPLIEYGARGNYVVISPQEGELSLAPDSPEWFAWLASLSSFRFVGQQGRLSASRCSDHGPKRTWYAYRCLHQQMYKRYLGTTDHLTIEVLEQTAAHLQSYVDTF